MSELKPCPITPKEAIDILQNSNTMLKSHIDEISAFVKEIPMGDSPYNNLDYCNCEFEAVELAIYALRRAQPANEPKGVEIDPVKNEPLTLDELRGMDGKPVYDGHALQWYVIEGVAVVDELSTVIHMTDGTDFDSEDGLPPFYRRKPERSENDAGRI